MSAHPDVVIAATDFSLPAQQAVDRAAALAAARGASLRLVHAVGEGDWLARMAQSLHGHFSVDLARKSAGSRLARERDRLVAAGVARVDYEVLEGNLSEALPHLLHDGGQGVLVVGARGESGWREGLLGSTADRVVRAGVLPVLLVRRPPAPPYSRVVLATDFSAIATHAARCGLHWAAGASVYLLNALQLPVDRGMAFAHATEATRAAYHQEAALEAARLLEAFGESLGPAGAAATRAPREGPPPAVLAAFVEEVGADLVVLGARPRARWEANLLGSTALFATARLDCDVLLVPGPA